MAADPTLVRLTAEVDRAVAALRAYVETGAVEPEDDLISLKNAVIRYDVVIETVRRWAKKEALGELIDGHWYLSKARVLKYKGR